MYLCVWGGVSVFVHIHIHVCVMIKLEEEPWMGVNNFEEREKAMEHLEMEKGKRRLGAECYRGSR